MFKTLLLMQSLHFIENVVNEIFTRDRMKETMWLGGGVLSTTEPR